MRVAALLAFTRAAEIAVDMGDGRMCAGEWCFDKPPEMKVSALSPPAGPVDGHTKVVVKGQGFRHFGTMMKCLYDGGHGSWPQQGEALAWWFFNQSRAEYS